jgi:hypothetical protein
MRTPWGESQHADQIAEGIVFYSTASHGGILLSPERRNEMPVKFRNEPTWAGGNWYEEDCDVSLVIYCFSQYFKPKTVEHATNYLKGDKPHLFV